MRNTPRKKTSSFAGYLIFFLTVAVMVTIALVFFMLVYRKTEGNLPLIALTMFLIIVFMSAVCTGVDIIRRRVMIDRPVREILSATEKIAAGDFSVRLTTAHSYDRYDDYDLIMDNLNAMAAELQRSEVLKTDFVSNVSHEIKTPLSVIQNYAQLIRVEKDEEKRKQYAQTIIEATNRLSLLVSDVLKLNKLENQELIVEKTRFSLDDSLAEAVLAFEDQYEKKNLEVECDFAEVEIVSSKSYLEIVWNNLLSNAVKFSKEGGKITVNVKNDGQYAVVSVTDTGVGIDPKAGEKIFEKFFQGDSSRATEGNGLGLALVKKVIDVLGGKISVSSEVGKGTVFTVTLKRE